MKAQIRRRLLLLLILTAAPALLVLPTATLIGAPPANVPNDERAITHALNRLAFGPDQDDVERVKRVGLGTWIEQQLHPERIKDSALDSKLARLTTLDLDPGTLSKDYFGPARRARRERQAQQGNGSGAGQPGMPPGAGQPEMAPGAMNPPGMMNPPSDEIRRERQVFADLAEAKLLRAVYSERQLEEVLVDFWFNHFNVFGRKGATELYVGQHERDAIRPHVLGNFRDLLEATAKSPAMLFYLDNWMSSDPNATFERPGRGGRGTKVPRYGKAGKGVAARPGSDVARDFSPANPGGPANGQPPARPPQMPRGLNENYARELLELHTLGVDGGYTQQDVVAVARALTGWTIAQPRGGGGFLFRAFTHDRGEKKVLGHTIPAGGGEEDGERVLDIVSAHPSTAKHIAFKLAQRFVSDTPPPALVDRAAARFRETKGDLREVVRTIITSPEFFAPEAYQAKVKTPFEFVVSALRATGAAVSSGVPVARALAAMGMPLYLCQPPTGYDETSEAWISSGALVNRINFALELAGNRMRGVSVPGGVGEDLAKALGAPEFQKQ